jgi:hypothetical protein
MRMSTPATLPQGYGRRAILRIIMCNLPSKCRCLRSFVTSEGMGGTGRSGDEPGPVGAGSGYGYGYGYGAGSVMTSFLGLEGVRRSVLGDRWRGGPPGRCDEEMGRARTLADAQQGRRHLPAAAAAIRD